MLINPTSVHIPSNYVLVKPDDRFDTFQFAGRETGILVSNYKIDQSGERHSTEMEHVTVTGIVFAVCESLDYRAREIWHIQDNASMRRGALVRVPEAQKLIDEHRRYSVQFDVDIEVEVGDRVFFDYFAHMAAAAEGLWVDTEQGKMMLIKYDLLILAECFGEIIPLNGNVIIENEAVVKQEVEHGITGIVRDSGIVLVGTKEEKRARAQAEAVVIYKSGICKSYLDNRGKDDPTGFFHASNGQFEWVDSDVEPGTKVLYDPRYAKELEFGLHRVFSERKLLRIQRKDIYIVLEENLKEVSYI